MSDAKKELSLDLDSSLDDIDDLPAFISFPTGAYHVVLEKGVAGDEKTGGFKLIGDHRALDMAMTLKDIVEFNEENLDEGEEPPKPGDIATQPYMMDNEYGAGNFKKDMSCFRATGASTVREIMAASQGAELLVVIKRRKGKKDKADQNYMTITKMDFI